MSENVYCDIRVEARHESELKDFLQLCAAIQMMGRIGTSRTIEVFVDGDGAGNLNFFVNGSENPVKYERGEDFEKWIMSGEGLKIDIGG